MYGTNDDYVYGTRFVIELSVSYTEWCVLTRWLAEYYMRSHFASTQDIPVSVLATLERQRMCAERIR